MAKFNTAVKPQKTTNLAGGKAYSVNAEYELATIALTSFLKDQFYRSEKDTIESISALVAQCDPQFVAQTAVFARRDGAMRSVSHLMASLLAQDIRAKGKRWYKPFFQKVVARPDDMCEILACFASMVGTKAVKGKNKIRPIPNAMKRGFARVLEGLDAYAIAKYKCEGKSISLVDVINLCRPRPSDAINSLMKGTLAPADTWEANLTKAGQEAAEEAEGAEDLETIKEEKKTEAWSKMLKGKKLKYFALLRNLRNLVKYCPDELDEICEQLLNEKAIKHSKVLPFRFQTAYEVVKAEMSGAASKKLLHAVSKAADIALANCPKFEGKTLIAVDVSSSMNGKPEKIARLFGACLLKSQDDADLLVFESSARYNKLDANDSVLSITDKINFSGGGTNFHSIFETAKEAYDRIVILSDMQAWMDSTMRGTQGHRLDMSFKAYKARTGADPLIYSFDLQGYGTLQFPQSKVYAFAGFSDKILEVMQMLEEDRNALLTRIKQVEL